MIGVISRTKIFEFRDNNELARSLAYLAKAYSCNVIIVTDMSDKVKAVLDIDKFTFNIDLFEETSYYIYGSIHNDDLRYEKNDLIRSSGSWVIAGIPFKFVNQYAPKELDV